MQEKPSTTVMIPASVMTGEEKVLAVLSHASLLLGVGLVLPLILYLMKREIAPAVAAHAREALNFQISLLLYSSGCVFLALFLVGFFLMFGLIVASLVLSIVASVKASEGIVFHYPLTLRIVK